MVVPSQQVSSSNAKSSSVEHTNVITMLQDFICSSMQDTDPEKMVGEMP